MGTLSDITMKVGNHNRVLKPSSKGYQALASPGSKENHAKTTSPRFMAPTQAFASRQTKTTSSPRASTPTSIGSANKSKPFLQRVKLRRTSRTQLDAKPPPSTKFTEDFSLPDKVCSLSLFSQPYSTLVVGSHLPGLREYLLPSTSYTRIRQESISLSKGQTTSNTASHSCQCKSSQAHRGSLGSYRHSSTS